MALTLLQMRERAVQSGPRMRVAAACWKAAYDVIASETPVANQLLWAKAVLGEDENGAMVQKMVRAVTVNPTIAAVDNWESVTDSDINYVVATVCMPEFADGIYGA